MCRNGQYTERGIKEIHGFMSERWRIEPEYAMKVGPLARHPRGAAGADDRGGQGVGAGARRWQRAFWQPRDGARHRRRPIGLLAALIGKQHGLEVHVLDRVETGPKPELVRSLGATYHTGTSPASASSPTSSSNAPARPGDRAARAVAAGGVVCLTGVGSGGRATGLRGGRRGALVLKNNVVVGTVNANKRHWYKAGQVLAHADPAWLARLITRREAPEAFMHALERQPDDIKAVIQFADA